MIHINNEKTCLIINIVTNNIEEQELFFGSSQNFVFLLKKRHNFNNFNNVDDLGIEFNSDVEKDLSKTNSTGATSPNISILENPDEFLFYDQVGYHERF